MAQRIITKENVTNSEMGDIRTMMEVCNLTEEQAFEEYNKSLDIPFDPSPFEWDD